MAKQAKFYVIESTTEQNGLSPTEALACDLAADAWRIGRKVLIACESEALALKLDEALWQRDPDQFVPHNLSGEISQYTTPVEIAWVGKRNAQRRDILIVLQTQAPEFAQSFNQVIDFVPPEESQKVQARERYKAYRQMGFEMSTERG